MKTLESLAQTVEDINIPRGRKGGFVPKVIDRFKASRLNKTIKKEITAWLNRPINKKFSYLFIDGIFLKIRRKIISKEAILCAVGMTDSGEKEFLGFLPACLSPPACGQGQTGRKGI